MWPVQYPYMGFPANKNKERHPAAHGEYRSLFYAPRRLRASARRLRPVTSDPFYRPSTRIVST
jgi:hypothetical protein